MVHDRCGSVGSGALEDAVRVVRVAEPTLSVPGAAGANKVVAKGDVDQQIGLARHPYIADFQIGTTVALAREQPLAAGGA